MGDEMKRVYKYELDPGFGNGISQVILPAGAQILHVSEQGGGIFLWAEVDIDAPDERREFLITGTGHGISVPEDRRKFIGTAMFRNENLVFHVYEVISP